MLCFFNIITIVLAILGLTKADTDLATANKYYKWGWIAYIIWAVLVIGVNLLLLLTGAFTASFETYRVDRLQHEGPGPFGPGAFVDQRRCRRAISPASAD